LKPVASPTGRRRRSPLPCSKQESSLPPRLSLSSFYHVRLLGLHPSCFHLTTGTFNLLSKTESQIRLSGSFQSNSRQRLAQPCVLENLSNLPRLIAACQPSNAIANAFGAGGWGYGGGPLLLGRAIKCSLRLRSFLHSNTAERPEKYQKEL
jgi:hypothetical protein